MKTEMIAKLVKTYIAKKAGLSVTCVTGPWVTVHHALTMAEAFEWMACYPAREHVVIVNNRNGKELAHRTGI